MGTFTPLVSNARVIAVDPARRRLTVTLPSTQTVSVRMGVHGPADGLRVSHPAMPGRGTEGIEARVLTLSALVIAAGMAVMTLPQSLATLGLGMLLFGAGEGPFWVALYSLRQRRTDPRFFSRAFILSYSGNVAGQPVASVVAGALLGIRALVPAMLIAVVLVTLLGLWLRKPAAAVPENAMKFVVGIMLTAFGLFWGAEGAGVSWPGHDAALLGLVPVIGLVSLGYTAMLRPGRGSGPQPAHPSITRPSSEESEESEEVASS